MSGTSTGGKQKQKQKQRAANSLSLLFGCTLSMYFARLDRAEHLASGHCCDDGARGLHANHRIFVRAEGADTGLVQGGRGSIRDIRYGRRTTGDAGGGEVVTALDARGQTIVDQAGRSRRRSADGIGSAAQSQ